MRGALERGPRLGVAARQVVVEIGAGHRDDHRRVAAAPHRCVAAGVVLRFLVGVDGRASAVAVAASSGFAPLDAAAIDAVTHAGPFPAPPAAVEVSVPVRFDLERRGGAHGRCRQDCATK